MGSNGAPARTDLLNLVRDNLHRLIPMLAAAAIAPVVAALANLPMWSRVGAALAALVSVLLAVMWIELPWRVWSGGRGVRIIAVAGALLAAAAIVALGFAARGEGAVVDPTARATLIILDASEGMAQPLGPAAAGTNTPVKLDEAVAKVATHAGDNQWEQQGLATFGSECESETPLRQRIGIAFNRQQVIKDELSTVRAAGRRNLVAAASNALSLLTPFDGAKSRRLVIVTGGLDGCGRDLRELIDNARGRDVTFTWDLVGLAFSESDVQQAQSLQDTGLRIHLANSASELDAALHSVLVESPIRAGFDDIRSFVTQDVRDRLQAADDAMSLGEATTAQSNLDQAAALIDSAGNRFTQLDTSGENAVFADLVELLRQMVKLQEQDLDLLQRRLAILGDDPPDKLTGTSLQQYRDLTTQNDAVIKQYSAKVPELEPTLERILAQLFKQ